MHQTEKSKYVKYFKTSHYKTCLSKADENEKDIRLQTQKPLYQDMSTKSFLLYIQAGRNDLQNNLCK